MHDFVEGSDWMDEEVLEFLEGEVDYIPGYDDGEYDDDSFPEDFSGEEDFA